MSLEKIQQKMEHLKMTHTLNLLSEMVDDAVKSKKSHLDFFDSILTAEIQSREESRIATSLRVSGLPKGMYLDNFDFLFQPSIDKARVDFLATCDFIQ